jgi:hypothetical protein
VLIVLSFQSCNKLREIDVASDKILCSECITVIGEKGKYLEMEIEKFESGKIKITTSPIAEKDVDFRLVQQGIIITEDYYIKYEEVGIKENIEEHWVFYANLEGSINSKDIGGGSGSYNISCNCSAPENSCSLTFHQLNDFIISFRCNPYVGSECTGDGTGNLCEIVIGESKYSNNVPTMLILKASEIEYNGNVYIK